MRRTIPLLLALLLTACGSAPQTPPPYPSGTSWQAQVRGTTILYRIVPAQALGGGFVGYAMAVPGVPLCSVAIDERYQNATVVAHEVAHCLDSHELLYTHGGFGDEGCAYHPYFCAPQEGFAETWARTYRAQCGERLQPLGWLGAQDGDCPLPDPRSITPRRTP